MPKVGSKKFPYTAAGKKAAKKEASMRGMEMEMDMKKMPKMPMKKKGM